MYALGEKKSSPKAYSFSVVAGVAGGGGVSAGANSASSFAIDASVARLPASKIVLTKFQKFVHAANITMYPFSS